MTNKTAIRFGYPATLIREYDDWLVLLREEQVTLGCLVMCAKSDAIAFSALAASAFEEMSKVIGDIERGLQAAVQFEKINYLMLMMVDPNVHFHVIPRYSSERSAAGITRPDTGWPAAPRLGDAQKLSSVEREALRAHLVGHW